ncbi:HypC/HybG/HupF family hydrogenase formation chaperone [Demequina sp. SO4-18]|uniref:HypC/HybG/HupF family hydrogenase formation chaperone n=1 Tax=Demequina sp. SO4-18 TaxID=3401026 RepID=UPI003B5919D5
MCLGTIARVIEVHRDGRAVVDVDGARQEVLEMTLSDDDIEPGDWVVINSGFALERLTEEQALEALRIRAADETTGEARPAQEGQPGPEAPPVQEAES